MIFLSMCKSVIQLPSNGLVFDLLHELQNEVNFTYTINHVEDSWGFEDVTTGKWSGMIGNLAYNKSDLAVQIFSKVAARGKV